MRCETSVDRRRCLSQRPCINLLLVSLFAASSASAQSRPPAPGSLSEGERPRVSESELAFLVEKVAAEEIPLLPDFNMISLPEESAASRQHHHLHL